MTISEKIKAIRTQKGLTQTEVAEKVGFERSYYSRLERTAGDRVYFDVLLKVCKALGVTIHELILYGEGKDLVTDQSKLKELEHNYLKLKAETFEKLEQLRRNSAELFLVGEISKVYLITLYSKGLITFEENQAYLTDKKEAENIYMAIALDFAKAIPKMRSGFLKEYFPNQQAVISFLKAQQTTIMRQSLNLEVAA